MYRFKRWLNAALALLLAVTLSVGLSAAWWNGSDSSSDRTSKMPQGDPITSPEALLRYALPIDNDTVRRLQESLEDIGTQLRAQRRWFAASSDVRTARRVVTYSADELLESVPESRRSQAESLIADLSPQLDALEAAIENQDREQTWIERGKTLDTVGELEALMVTEFPFEVPEEYADLPQLKGRATVEMVTEKGKITIVVDGYNAPITAGNFVDLVQRGFYDNIDVTRAEKFYVVQAGDPPGPETGFVDPKTGELRTIPLEIKIQTEALPIYEFTLEQIGLYQEDPVLPFSAYGALAMAHSDIGANDASSQFFFLRRESEMTPAGANVLDGRYAVFGYAIAGEDVLANLDKGDKIQTVRVVEGGDNLVLPEGTES